MHAGPFCSQCGRAYGAAQALPIAVVNGATALATTTPGSPAVSSGSVHADRFALARRDPALGQALSEHVAAPRRPIVYLGLPLIAILVGATLVSDVDSETATLGIALGACVMALAFLTRRRSSAMRRQLAYVVDRQALSSSAFPTDNVLAAVTVPVVLELEDGRRLLVRGPAAVAGTLVPGDCGVAHLAGEELVRFRRLIAPERYQASSLTATG